MNTARSFGPAAITGFAYRQHWVVSASEAIIHKESDAIPSQYWVGPTLGSFVGSAIYLIVKR